MQAEARTLRLETGGEHYILRYWPGDEDKIVREIKLLAADPSTNVTWLDAAKMSFEVLKLVAAE